jgi:hypothetical protein
MKYVRRFAEWYEDESVAAWKRGAAVVGIFVVAVLIVSGIINLLV